MFYLADYEAYVYAYLTNCGENPDNWDVNGAATELRDVQERERVPRRIRMQRVQVQG